MTRRTLALGSLVTGAAVLAWLAVGPPFDRAVQAQSQSQGTSLTGTWFNAPGGSGLTGFWTFHQDGTMAGTRSHEFGGPPRPGSFRSALRGVWRRAGNTYDVVSYGFGFDGSTGDATSIVRIRQIFSVEVGYDRATAVAFVTQWTCPTPLTCPDPNDPANVPLFEDLPIGTASYTRVRTP